MREVTLDVMTLVPREGRPAAGDVGRSPEGSRRAFPRHLGSHPELRRRRSRRRQGHLDVWKRARVIKCNPDAPQLPLRRAALQDGKVVYMAVPRLRAAECFVEIDPSRLSEPEIRHAASISGSALYGRPVHPRDMPAIDLVVTGVVAAGRDDSRLGKGGGYSDLEHALLVEVGKLDAATPIITTAHRLQLSEDGLPMHRHDIPLDYIVTPDEVIECAPMYGRPTGIEWRLLPRERIEEIPILFELWRDASGGRAQPLHNS